MDMARGINDPLDSVSDVGGDEAVSDRPLDIGTDERRMHVRAYNYWVSLLDGRPYPSIEDIDPGNIADFGPHSVLLDFTASVEDPAIRYLGPALRGECGVTPLIKRIAEVPSRSLLSRLTDHYLQIIANRAPIGFEAEFVGQRGHNTLYRGILMPFSSDGDTIDFIFGVINWKELLDAETQAKLHTEIDESRRSGPHSPGATPVWADGPSAGFDAPEEPLAISQASSLADQLMLARESAAVARASDTRSRSALYRALGRAYDFARAAEGDPDGYAELLADAGLSVQARAPMTPAVKLVFGADYDKTRITEFAAVLTYARRGNVPSGGLDAFVEAAEGGIKAIVRAERELRRPAVQAGSFAEATQALRGLPALAHVEIQAGEDEFVLLLARAGEHGFDIVASLEDDPGLTERAIRRAVSGSA